MENSNNRAGNMQKHESEQLEARKSDATSKKTLTDVKREEKIPDTNRSGEGTSVPSPDGTPDPDRGSGRADGSDPSGPI